MMAKIGPSGSGCLLSPEQPIAVYMQGCVGMPEGKTGQGVLRYSTNPIVAVVDRGTAGASIDRYTRGLTPTPIVASPAEAWQLGARVLILGVANPGGFVPDRWRADLDDAVAQGFSLVNGLHEGLQARYPVLRPGQWIWDVRREPQPLRVGSGAARTLRNRRVLFIGSDMNVGKMTAALELDRALRQAGVRSVFVATGQTGIVIAGRGVALDAVRVDYAAGAIEAAVMAQTDAQAILVEGQGSLGHPASTATLPLLRGAMPTDLVFCHRAGQSHLANLPEIALPPLRAAIDLACALAEAGGVFRRPNMLGLSLNTAHLGDVEAKSVLEAFGNELGLPICDPLRTGPGPLVEALEHVISHP